MDIERNSSIGLELKHSLLCTTVELQNTKIAMEEELIKRDNHLLHLKALLDTAIAERDEAQERCQSLLLRNQNLILHHHHQQLSSPDEEDELTRTINAGFFSTWSSSGDCEEETLDSMIPPEKPLPEKGKLLQAVMRAGPLLQTMLLAGPLPQWQRPPPPIDLSQIPPVEIPSPPPLPPINNVQDSQLNCSRVCGKRGRLPNRFFESPAKESKCQRHLLL